MFDFSNICNISFVYYAKQTTRDILLFPAVNKQMGKSKNYVVVLDAPYDGVYEWDPAIAPTLKKWRNKTMETYVLPLEKVKKIQELEDIDPSYPLGQFMIRIIDKMRGSR